MPDLIITLARHPGSHAAHFLVTLPDAVKWRKTEALCGVAPPDALGWQEHHSARLVDLCPACVSALAQVRAGVAA